MKEKENNGIVLIILLFIGVVLVFLFPKIHEYINKTSLPEVEKSNIQKSEETKDLTREMLNEVHSPIMRNSVYQEKTYYSQDTFKPSDMSNQDILLNSFLEIYEGNITDSNYNSSCSDMDKEFNSVYIGLNVKAILNRNLNFNLENFTVPEDAETKYPGNWIYEGGKYYYDGICTYSNNEYKYYDIESLIDYKYDGDDIVVTYYVGFVRASGESYTIYNDAAMTNEIYSGVGNNYKDVFDTLNNNLKKKYQYRYKNTICTYDEYCLYEGKWLND